MVKNWFLLAAAALALSACALPPSPAPLLNPLTDYRATGQVQRTATGATQRSPQVLAAFRALYHCPATKSATGPCPGWAIDHVIPLACGGADAVYNLQWLPNEIKSERGQVAKDRFERVVYGGHAVGRGCR